MLPDDLRKSLEEAPFGSRSPHQRRVEEFMRLANQEVPPRPTVPGADVRRFRAKMILEEALETIHGLGFNVKLPPGERVLTEECYDLVSDGHMPPNLVEIVDGCCDIRVVTTGTLSACGMPDELVQYEVDRNNLAKFGPGGYRRESDGKWMKPPGHKPPRIVEVIAHYKEERRCGYCGNALAPDEANCCRSCFVQG